MRAGPSLALALVLFAPALARAQGLADAPRTIERVKASVVAVGSFQRTRSPAFRFLGTGFAVGDGVTIATNAHVLPALAVRDSDGVREGEAVLFTGFPIGNVLGPYPATHRGMIAAITPIAIPPPSSSQLDTRAIRQLASGAFPVFQLDATAYPGNSGSPVYAPATGEVIGVVNMVFVKGSKESALTQPSGITYAIPSRHLVELMKQGAR